MSSHDRNPDIWKHGQPYQWKPGVSPNPGGLPKFKRWRTALLKALEKYKIEGESGEVSEALDRIAERVVVAALAGDSEAIQEIANRLDGKPVQSVELGDPDNGPVGLAVVFHGSSRDAVTRDPVPTQARIPLQPKPL